MAFTEEWSREVATTRDAAWAAIRATAGTGTGPTALLWRARGTADRALDRLLQPSPDAPPRPVWRREGVEPHRALHLVAGSRLPGEARLELRMEPTGTRGRWRLTQRSEFRPAGPLGTAYWYAVLPAHTIVFTRMFDDLVRAAEDRR